MTRAVAAAPAAVVDLDEITKIELIVARRLQERTTGEHRSSAEGTGFDLVGLRDYQPGDRLSSIDWAQSSLTNFAPLVVREFDQPSTTTVIAVADLSPSTQCGVVPASGVSGEGSVIRSSSVTQTGAARGSGADTRPTTTAGIVARAIATIGLSASFFQDRFGLIAFDRDFSHLAGVVPRTGRNHVVHCLDAYIARRGLEPVMHNARVSTTLAASFRTTSLVAFVSDFLFDDAAETIRELALLNATHDVFLVLVDAAFAFELPPVSSEWIDVEDAETGETRTLSRAGYLAIGRQVAEWQNEIERAARDADLDVVRIGTDEGQNDLALCEFVAERRLRKGSR
jgi:uncharacterized protein (DUF58 family)